VTDRRVAILTGASGCLGTELARRLAGDFEIVAVRHKRALSVDTQHQTFFDPLDPDVEGPFFRAYEVTADLTQPADRTRLCEVAAARGRVELLVNAAGVNNSSRLLSASAEGGADRVFAVNAFAPILLAREISEQVWMPGRTEGGGLSGPCVVNCSAAASLDSDSDRDAPMFAASKAALNVLSGHLAAEMAPFGVRVNCLLPAPFPDVVPVSRVADAVIELISSSDTGQMLAVWPDGNEYL
jgi:NAD(P)-dependent dehydrogenase (short-subunit alcohol dehydrogenase family)